MEKNDPRGGNKWDVFEATSLYFPEVHTTSYEKAEKLCRAISDRAVTDEEERPQKLRNALLTFSVRHALDEYNIHHRYNYSIHIIANLLNCTEFYTSYKTLHL